MNFTFVCVCGKIEQKNIYLKLEFETGRSRRLVFSPPTWWPPAQPTNFERPVADTKAYIPAVQKTTAFPMRPPLQNKP